MHSTPLGAEPNIIVVCPLPDRSAHERARTVAEHLNLPCVTSTDAPRDAMHLVVTDERLELCDPRAVRQKPYFVDFLGESKRSRRFVRSARKELIARAVGLKNEPMEILDATAGFAWDAFILATLGCRVQAFERSPVVAALVQDGLARARAARRPEITEILDRLTFTLADARDVLRTMPGRVMPAAPAASAESVERSGAPMRANASAGWAQPDVVYLDPMYPASGQSALNRKELRWLRILVGDDADVAEWFEAALAAARRRVVVKRPRHAPRLAPHVDVQYRGRSVRYDVYFPCGRSD